MICRKARTTRPYMYLLLRVPSTLRLVDSIILAVVCMNAPVQRDGVSSDSPPAWMKVVALRENFEANSAAEVGQRFRIG